ncbi:nuclear polyadenylated RNA-binding protein [Grosmannia clavigera kw1407]|uniref:Nuclear polyadenylated RNA-binding protein n=1 Tax=Grosmannia clavigera (strain kw1407 / UAMH 11150) TaxID=655863 RepID=F0XHG8_GROCL|nr:nuclear polyadenylated RNA-binding protein [Grosmannia clavigera kw1407]EFX03059.1 nuclear polyadenylated RNA-binding protein [Grosmannia clavigera kw1407]
MPVEVAMNTPLAEALQREIQPKLVECGWAPSDASDTTMAEYLILMIVNGKTEDEIASELSSDLLNLPPEDDSAKQFARWLFEIIESENARINGSGQQQQFELAFSGGDQDMEMDLSSADALGSMIAPSGPKAMRNGPGFRGGRDKRMLGQINRNLDRSNDSVLHRVRGTDRISTHTRGGGAGPRGSGGGFGMGRQQRNMNGRNASGFNQQAMAAVMSAGGPQPGMSWMGPPGPPGQPPMQPGPMDVYAMLEQQSRMMQQMQEQMQQQQQLMQHGRRGGFNQQSRGRPLADRIQHPNQNYRNNMRNGGQNNHGQQAENGGEAPKSNGKSQEGGDASGSATGEDVDMGSEAGTHREPLNPTDTVCKYNLHCTNKDCKFAHQSPAAPPGTTVDVLDVCTYGAACKKKKVRGAAPVASRPDGAPERAGLQIFFPTARTHTANFGTRRCRCAANGGDCAHEEGQRGVFPDKVWTADGAGRDQQTHISERKFVDETAAEETILPSADRDMTSEEATIA